MERSAFGVIHKALPKGLLFHGTHNAGASKIMRQGWKPSGFNDGAGMGVGSYQTPTYNSALSYGTSKGHGWQVGAETSTTGSAHMSQTGKSFRRGKVIGQIVMSKPRPGAKPITSRGKGMASESLWKPEDIKPIGTQNINRTSAQRASRGNPEYKQLVQQRKAAATPPKTLGELKTRLKARKAERDHARLLNDIDL